MKGWIKADEQLPDIGVSIIAYFASDDALDVVEVTGYIRACISDYEYSPVWSQISHWMPLPDKPEF